MKKIIRHIHPEAGGVAEYAKVIAKIYEQKGFEVQATPLKRQPLNAKAVAAELATSKATVYHFEIGAPDGWIFNVCSQLLAITQSPVLVTIHDPGAFVWHPVEVSLAYNSNAALRFVGKGIRKVLDVLVGRRRLQSVLSNPHVSTIYLRKDLAEADRSHYLPQPTYHQKPPSTRKITEVVTKLGYGGYWGHWKGLETLMEAWANQEGLEDLDLVVSGDGGAKGDSYADTLRQKFSAMEPRPQLPGFISDVNLDKFLTSLSALVLPYWPELQNGTSAMAMRAIELGVPIIASDVPALREQLGDTGALYVEPANARELHQAFIDLQNNWQAIQQRTLKAQARILQEHSWQAVGSDLSKIIVGLTK